MEIPNFVLFSQQNMLFSAKQAYTKGVSAKYVGQSYKSSKNWFGPVTIILSLAKKLAIFELIL